MVFQWIANPSYLWVIRVRAAAIPPLYVGVPEWSIGLVSKTNCSCTSRVRIPCSYAIRIKTHFQQIFACKGSTILTYQIIDEKV